MMTTLVISEALLMVAVVVLAVIVFAMARQIGVLHERLAPIGAQTAAPALSVGQAIPRISMTTLAGTAFPIGEPLNADAVRMVLFVAPDCPICKRVIPAANDVAASSPGVELVLVGDGALPELQSMRERLDLGGVPFVTGPELALVLQVARLPTLVLLDERGVLRAREIVNTRGQIEAMIAAVRGGESSAAVNGSEKELLNAV